MLPSLFSIRNIIEHPQTTIGALLVGSVQTAIGALITAFTQTGGNLDWKPTITAAATGTITTALGALLPSLTGKPNGAKGAILAEIETALEEVGLSAMRDAAAKVTNKITDDAAGRVQMPTGGTR